MRTKLLHLIAALLLLSRSAYAQDTVSFTISIIDTAYLPVATQSGGYLTLSFQQPALSDVAGQYAITIFEQAYPVSHLEHLQQVYLIRASSISLMNAWQNAYPEVFIGGKLRKEPVWKFTPNDFGKAFGNRQEELKLIKAEQAWSIDSGGSNIVIGMTDEKVF